MAKKEKVTKVKGRKKQKRMLKVLITFIAIGLIAFATVYVVPQVKNRIDVSNSDNADGKLVSTDGEIVGTMSLSSGAIAVTTDSIVSFKTNGSVRYEETLGYSKPVFKSAEKKFIVFERTTGKYTVADKSKVIVSGDLDEDIVNADVASNGNYAIITGSSQSKMRLSVRSSKNKEIFAWECSDDYLTDVALSKNGKSVAVSAINVVDGEVYSCIYHFNVNSLEIEGQLEYPNETVYKIKFIDNEKLSVITDTNYIIADIKEKTNKILGYEYDTLAAYSFGANSSVAILKKGFGSLNEKKITVIDKNCEAVFEKTVESEVLDFAVDSKRVYILISGKIIAYSISSGEMAGDTQVDASVSKIFISKKTLLGVSDSGIYKYEIK